MNRIATTLIVAAVGTASFAGTAAAAGAAVPDDGSLLDLAKPLFSAVMGGNYWLAASLALVLMVAVCRRYLPKWFPKAFGWAAGDAGGALLVLLGAFGGAMATGLAAGAGPSVAMAVVAFKVALGAAGGFTMLKKLIAPALRAMQDKAPAWARPILGLLAWVAERPDAIGKAEAAGDAAVAAKPAPGIEGVLGKPRVLK